MKILMIRKGIQLLAVASVAALALATVARGQMGGYSQPPPQQSPLPSNAPTGQASQAPAAPAAPPVNPKEQADYKAFYDAKADNVDLKIQLGTVFLSNYPTSIHKEAVYNGLLHAYYTKQDWTNFYSTGDKVIALDPDDVDALALVGWVIPHTSRAADPDAALKLAKAETYDKHVIDVMTTMAKPATVTDADFATMKQQALEQAHSGLGLVYYREQKTADAVTELQQATATSPSPDPADLYVLGVELQQLGKNADAADAFQKCSAIPGALQDRCKTNADQAKKAK
jgi:tetratricopeptide (TPR) repeat protein